MRRMPARLSRAVLLSPARACRQPPQHLPFAVAPPHHRHGLLLASAAAPLPRSSQPPAFSPPASSSFPLSTRAASTSASTSPTTPTTSSSTTTTTSRSPPASPAPLTAAAVALEDEVKRAPRINHGRGEAARFRVTGRQRLPPYRLKPLPAPSPQLPLEQELSAFFTFLTEDFFDQQEQRVRPVTARKYVDIARGLLGWLHLERGVPLMELSLRTAFPSPERQAARTAFDHMRWLVRERGVTARTELLALRTMVNVAKFLFQEHSQANPNRGDRPFQDIELITELRGMSKTAKKRAATAAFVADSSKKWLDWDEFLQVVHTLRDECALRNMNGQRRTASAVAWSLQRYLIVGILSVIPDRQRTLRELELGRTLRRSADGQWAIHLSADDYKTGRIYGDRAPLVISPHLYPELEAWLDHYRAELNPDHTYVFTQKNGRPPTDNFIYKTFSNACFRLSGKRTNPHMVRQMIVTHLRTNAATDAELESLAELMAHSLEMQRSAYDQRTRAQKVAPAVSLLSRLASRGVPNASDAPGSAAASASS